jgi:fibronectin type 3 domain-containing protein
MKLYWKAMGAMPGGSNYKLYRSVTEQNSPAGTPQPLITIPAPTTTYDDANIATFKLYYYWVSVISPTGFESPKSNELHALGLPVPAPALPPPPGLKAEQIVGPSVKVSWGTSIPTGGTAADTKQYLLDITYWANAKDPSPTSKRRETLKGTQLTYTISTVRAGHRYAFQVIAVNADGKQSAPSNIVELVVK